MALKRPGFPADVAANATLVRGDQKFFNIAADTAEMIRFLPAPREDGLIFYPVTNHYGLVNQDKRNIALACLHQHGGGDTERDCLLCASAKALSEGSPAEKEIAARLKPSTRHYAQIVRAEVSNGQIKGWSRPMLLQLPKTAAQTILGIFKSQQTFGDDLATDTDRGQAIIIRREGTGFQTKYPAERSGTKVGLDEIRPTWGDEFMEDLYEEIGLNVADRGLQAAYLRISFPAVKWDEVFESVGFVEAE